MCDQQSSHIRNDNDLCRHRIRNTKEILSQAKSVTLSNLFCDNYLYEGHITMQLIFLILLNSYDK